MSWQPSPLALRIGEWIADPSDDSLTRGSERQRIDPRAMSLLLRLASTPGQVVSQSTLLDEVWAGVVVGPASVYQTVSQLRKALGDTDSPPSYIETVARKGYRLVATVSPFAAPPAEAPRADARAPRWRLLAPAAAVLALVGGSVWWNASRQPVASIPSLVVLPFADMTADKSEQAFCDGLTEETANWLAQIPNLRVVGRTSAYAFQGKGIDVRRVGQELGVGHVVEGSVRRQGDIMRVTIRVVSTRDGTDAWRSNFDEVVGDTIVMQEKIARSISAGLEVRITPDTEARLAARRTTELEANYAYTLALPHFLQRTAASTDRAVELFRSALRADPQFSLAKAVLALAYLNQYTLGARDLQDTVRDVMPLLAEVARDDPELPELYTARGVLNLELGKREESLRDLRHALAMDPNRSLTVSALGKFHLTAAEPREALRYYTRATEIEPRNAEFHAFRCATLAQMGEFNQAQAECRQARTFKPDSFLALWASSKLEEAQGRPVDALRYMRLILRLNGGMSEPNADRAHWLLRLGKLAEARQAYEQARADLGPDDFNANLTLVGLRTAYGIGGAEALRAELIETGSTNTTDPELLFVIAETALIARDPALAGEYLARAMEASRDNPSLIAETRYLSDGTSFLAIAAAVELGLGRAEAAREHLRRLEVLLERAANAGMRTYGFAELRARSAALGGRPDEALAALREAALLGWRDCWLAEHAPYFDSIRERAEYREMVTLIERRNEADGRILAANSPVTPHR